MTSREAFEAHILRTQGDQPYLVGGTYNNVGWRKDWELWQAAIQHAREVAVNECERVKMKADAAAPLPNLYSEGRSDGAAQCAAAVKEALK